MLREKALISLDGHMKKKKSKLTSKSSSEIRFLNPEEIKARRVPIEESHVFQDQKWFCNFCSKKFSSEMTFMRHHCEPRRRFEELKSPIGQAAYSYYSEWMRKRKFSVPPAAAFMESKLYRAFIAFANMVVDANISKPEKYIELMVMGEIQPVLWCREQCYAIYLEWNDKLIPPLDQVQDSINYLFDIAEKENVKITEIFNHLGPQRVLSLIRQRRLSPWFLFCSQQFGKMLRDMDTAQMKTFNGIIAASYWSARFQQEKSTLEIIKNIITELQL
jgi:hypothetical protein